MTTAERVAALQTTLDRYILELSQGDIKPDYTINGQSVSWTTYRDKLHQWIEETLNQIEMVDDEGGIVEENTQYMT
jgi:hypothetical protein